MTYRTIITTVGTSLITNWLQKEKGINSELKEYVEDLKNQCFYNTRDKEDNEDFIEYAGEIKKEIKSFLAKKDKPASAETNSLFAIKEELEKKHSDLALTVYLICTDTILSPLCAEVLSEWLKGQGFEVDFHEEEDIIEKIGDNNFVSDYIVKDLRVDDKDAFEKQGFQNLINIFQNISSSKNCILNISGGYKILIPILTIISQLEEVDIEYLFEDDKSQLLEIPFLPINFDWIKAEIYAELLDKVALRRYDKTSEEYKFLERMKLVKPNGGATIFGGLLKGYLEKKMDKAPDILGDFAEYKIYEHFHNYPYKAAYNKVEKGVKLYFDKDSNYGKIYTEQEYKEIGNGHEEVEIDLILSNSEDNYIIVESKFFRQVKNLCDKIEKRIKAMHLLKGGYADEFILYIPKLSIQNLRKKKHLKDFKDLCQEYHITFTLLYTDIRVDTEKVKIDFTSFIKGRFELGPDKDIKEYQIN